MDALADLRAVTGVTTPAFVYAPDVITSRISRTRAALRASARLLFSVKALTVFDALKFIAPEVDGFSVSSFFEARIASEAGLARHANQYVSPLLRESECRPLTALCRRITLNSLVEQINRITGKNIAANHGEPRQGDIKHSQADIEKAASRMGYRPLVSFEDGLKNTVEWYRGNLPQSVSVR